nr:DUF3551 domain-containing protein [Bradyrhizobium sp. 157]
MSRLRVYVLRPAWQDAHCLQRPYLGHPGNCQFSSFCQCMATASRKRTRSGRVLPPGQSQPVRHAGDAVKTTPHANCVRMIGSARPEAQRDARRFQMTI